MAQMAHSPGIRRRKGAMTTSITSTTTTINTTMMITMVTVMADKALRRAYLGAYEKYEDELKRL